jgi:hypothetical protein
MKPFFTTGFATSTHINEMIAISVSNYKALYPEAGENKYDNRAKVMAAQLNHECALAPQGNILYPAIFDKYGELLGWSRIKHDKKTDTVLIDNYHVADNHDVVKEYLEDHAFEHGKKANPKKIMIIAAGRVVTIEHNPAAEKIMTRNKDEIISNAYQHISKIAPEATKLIIAA